MEQKMSFLSELLKRKQNLKETDTLVTRADGKTHIERKSGSETVEATVSQKSYGFIVDTKPDDVPALILDHLFIGSQDCTHPIVLNKYNIISILSLGIEVPVESVNVKFVPCLDLPETDIQPILFQCLPFIRDAVELKKNVLIHCNAGVSRTAMVAIAYLIVHKQYSYDEAYKLVKYKRPAIQPNSGFLKQLKLLPNIVCELKSQES